MVSICAWWSDIIDGESVSAVDFVSEHGDILDVTETDVDIAPEAADGFIEGEGGGAGDEHERFDGAGDECDDLGIDMQMGSESCRERVWPDVERSGGAVQFKKKRTYRI